MEELEDKALGRNDGISMIDICSKPSFLSLSSPLAGDSWVKKEMVWRCFSIQGKPRCHLFERSLEPSGKTLESALLETKP